MWQRESRPWSRALIGPGSSLVSCLSKERRKPCPGRIPCDDMWEAPAQNLTRGVSSRGAFCPHRTCGDVRRRFWFSQLVWGRCSWRLVRRDQGCCRASSRAQGSPTTKNQLDHNVDGARVENLLSSSINVPFSSSLTTPSTDGKELPEQRDPPTKPLAADWREINPANSPSCCPCLD